MRVFLTGGTGILGRSVVPKLVAGGHTVVGAVRSADKGRALESLGASAVPVDVFRLLRLRCLPETTLPDWHGIRARTPFPRCAPALRFDAAALTRACAGAEVVAHLATSIPDKARSTAADWAPNDRLRREGTKALVEAALAAGARAYVQQSVAWVYGDRGDDVLAENEPVNATGIIASMADAEATALAAADRLSVTILRGGGFVHADSPQTKQILVGLRAGRMPIVGRRPTWMSFVHVDDMADAVVTAVEGAIGVYNVAGEPATMADLWNGLCDAMRVSRPWTIPPWVARLGAGAITARMATTSVRVSSERLRSHGWTPRHPTWREMFSP